MKIVIVGAEEKYWTEEKASLARYFIAKVMDDHPDATYISGDCPKGGVDIWVREIAEMKGRDFKPFPPQKKSWYWYRKRNMKMALEGDIIIDLEPAGNWSGGTWTLQYAESKGKQTLKVEF